MLQKSEGSFSIYSLCLRGSHHIGKNNAFRCICLQLNAASVFIKNKLLDQQSMALCEYWEIGVLCYMTSVHVLHCYINTELSLFLLNTHTESLFLSRLLTRWHISRFKKQLCVKRSFPLTFCSQSCLLQQHKLSLQCCFCWRQINCIHWSLD